MEKISLFKRILIRAMKEKKFYREFKEFIDPTRIDIELIKNVQFPYHRKVILWFKHFEFVILNSSYMHNTEQKIHYSQVLFSQKTHERRKKSHQFFYLLSSNKLGLNSIILYTIRPWVENYIKSFLNENLKNFENYISIKYHNKYQTLEQYLDHCVDSNMNIFQIINTPTSFIKTQEGTQFWTQKNNMFVKSLLSMLLSSKQEVTALV